MKQKINPKLLLKELHSHFPVAECALHHKTPYQLLIATILSAQCTDERVNKVTPDLFKKFPTAVEMSKSNLQELEELVRTTGFYKNKAKNILNCSKKLIEIQSFQKNKSGEVPQNLETLTSLDGVGRKTANVVLGVAYQISSGIVVDTHVGRLSQRLGLSREKDPLKIEQDLLKQIPQSEWTEFSLRLILLGRQICKARKPDCETCFLADHCPSVDS